MGMFPELYGPYMIGLILESGSDIQYQWNLCFYVTSAMTIASGVIFCMTASCEQQEWDKVEEDECVIVKSEIQEVM